MRRDGSDVGRARLLGASDVDALRGLMEVFAEAFEDPDTYLGSPPSTEHLEGLLAGECFLALVSEDGDRVVGGLTAYVLRKPEQERSEIYVYDLAVSASHRRRGIATALLEELRSVARLRGAWVAFVQADENDEPAIALYSKFGTREDVHHFDIRPEE